MTLRQDEAFMAEALAEARYAAACDEVPVGAVVVHGDTIIARAHNVRESARRPTGHAELIAIEAAAAALGDWRLTGTTLYVTLEPCLMCVGAIILARVTRVVYGASDPKAGMAGGVFNAFQLPANHTVEVLGGVLKDESSQLLKAFFRQKRREVVS